MMTRKDYIQTARILNDNKYAIQPFEFAEIVQQFSEMFENDNPRFSVERFEEACYA